MAETSEQHLFVCLVLFCQVSVVPLMFYADFVGSPKKFARDASGCPRLTLPALGASSTGVTTHH